MKFVIPILSALLLCSCASATPPPKAAKATPQECDSLYVHVVMVSLFDSGYVDQSTPQEGLTMAAAVLNEHFNKIGLTAKFIGYCNHKMNSDQVACMMNANHTEDLEVCNKMFK